MHETTTVGADADFTRTHTIAASPETLRAAVTTADGVSAWWVPTVSPGPELLTMSFGDTEAQMRVVATPDLVVWHVLACSAEPDWVGTTIEFASAPNADGSIELVFTHRGLGALPCAETCFAGWSRYVPSLVSYLEGGVGNPSSMRS